MHALILDFGQDAIDFGVKDLVNLTVTSMLEASDSSKTDVVGEIE